MEVLKGELYAQLVVYCIHFVSAGPLPVLVLLFLNPLRGVPDAVGFGVKDALFGVEIAGKPVAPESHVFHT